MRMKRHDYVFGDFSLIDRARRRPRLAEIIRRRCAIAVPLGTSSDKMTLLAHAMAIYFSAFLSICAA